MKPERIRKHKEFIDNNRESLEVLRQLIKSVDTCKGAKSIEEVLGREKAIGIMDEWLTQLWSITTEDLPEPEESEELYRVND